MPERRLSKNVALAVVPWAVPTFVALIAVPITVKGLGDDAYGVIALVGAVAGYLALLQFGIGKGVIRFISMFAAAGEGRAMRECLRVVIVWSSVVGLIGGLAMWASATWLVTSVLKVPVAMQSETIRAFQIGGVAFAFGAVSAPFSLIPNAFLRYDLVAVMQTTFVSLGLAGPAVLVLLGYGLLPCIAFSAIMNAVALLTFGLVTAWLLRGVPDVGPGFGQHRRKFISFVLTEGTNQVWCLIQAQTNKMVIGIAGGTSQAAYFQVSNTMSDRANGLLNNMASVLLPTVSQLAAEGEHEHITGLYERSSRLLFVLNASITSAVVVFSAPLLAYWIDPRYAEAGATALALLIVAQAIAATSQAGGNVNLALGRPKINLVFSVINSIVNLGTVYPLTVTYGITGTALSILLAAFVMPTFVHYTNRKVLHIGSWPVFRDCYMRTLVIATTVSVGSWFVLRPLASNLIVTLGLLGLTILASLLVASLFGVITAADRESFRAALRREKPPVSSDGDAG